MPYAMLASGRGTRLSTQIGERAALSSWATPGAAAAIQCIGSDCDEYVSRLSISGHLLSARLWWDAHDQSYLAGRATRGRRTLTGLR
jgi:hypothetical protein